MCKMEIVSKELYENRSLSEDQSQQECFDFKAFSTIFQLYLKEIHYFFIKVNNYKTFKDLLKDLIFKD